MKPEVPRDVKPSALVGGQWKARQWKKGVGYKGSQTPGKSKGDTCKADAMKKFFARRSKSYKHEGYGNWCKMCDGMNAKKMN